MMKNILGLIAFLVTGFVFSQNMELSSTTIDMGKLNKGVSSKTTITIKNTGSAPLIITKVSPSCGCTVPTYPKKPIMPGKSEEMTITYNAEASGTFNKSIEVYSNDKNASRRIIKIKGKVN